MKCLIYCEGKLKLMTKMMLQLPKREENPNRPVLVYYHAGGWFSNTGASFVHGPQYLTDQDIVLVVTNYRLAALGKHNKKWILNK